MLTKAHHSFLRDQSGSILPVAVLVLGVTLGMGALAIDSSRGFATRDQLQAAADAAALAGASVVSNTATATSLAVEFANKNAPAGAGSVIDASNVAFGTWDSDTHTFSGGGANPNAVQVTASISQANGNAMPTAFASLFGVSAVDVVASAIATGDNGQQWDVVIAQDVTSSFSQELPDAVTADQTLLQCIQDRAAPESLIGGVMFTGYGTDMGPMDEMQNSFQNIYDTFGNLQKCNRPGMPPCSGTHIGAGIEAANNLFANAPSNPDSAKAMVIVSDGKPNCKSPACSTSTADLEAQAIAAADAADADGISVFTVLYNEQNDPSASAFLAGLARGDGTFHETPDPTLLTNLLLEICNTQLPLRLVN